MMLLSNLVADAALPLQNETGRDSEVGGFRSNIH